MNNRQTTLITHIVSWAALMLLPMMFMHSSAGITTRNIFMSMGVTLSFLCVFYPNFLIITPRYYIPGERRYFLLLNALVVIIASWGFYGWVTLGDEFFPDSNHSTPCGFQLSFLLRTMFNLSIVVVVSTALQLASRWRQAEVARTEAELKTLRNQINPHFLLNTLNNIYALTVFDSAKAQEAIQQLSKMLRHLLYDYEQPQVPLKDEVEFLQNYVSLMRIRLPQCVEVTSHFSIANPQLTVAPMLFIPLLENAFKHGISPSSPSFIHLQLTADEHTITCSIENSNHPKTEQDQSGHGIGLQQVQRRLELSYPGRHSWKKGVSDDGRVYTSCIILNTSY